MRHRLSKDKRRSDILQKARQLILDRGLSGTEMEDIRLACGISRGGLYHHFANKRAVLDALVDAEVAELAKVLNQTSDLPIKALLQAGSNHLGNDAGVVCGLKTDDEKLAYLSSLDQAITAQLSAPLRDGLERFVQPETDAGHIAELFLTVNSHINRREVLGQWTPAESASFAATALQALAPFLRVPTELDPLISELRTMASL